LFYNLAARPDLDGSELLGALQDNGIQTTAGAASQPTSGCCAPSTRGRAGPPGCVDCDGCCDCQGGCGCAGHDHDHHKHDHRNELQPDDTAYYGHPDGGKGHGLHRCRGSFKIISNPFPETIHPGASLPILIRVGDSHWRAV
jgi:hypothetical protein